MNTTSASSIMCSSLKISVIYGECLLWLYPLNWIQKQVQNSINLKYLPANQPTTDKAVVWLINHWRSDLNKSKSLTNSYNDLAKKHNGLLTELELAKQEILQLKGYVSPIYKCA